MSYMSRIDVEGASPAHGFAVDPPSSPQGTIRACLAAIRPHQWAKNLLLFVPLVTAHRLDLASIGAQALACLAFCCAASAAYCVNDLLDRDADRLHPRKRRRPFASGRLSAGQGIAMTAGLLAGAGAFAMSVSPALLGMVGFYVALTLAYSVVLKCRMVVDVIALSGLYTVRVAAGIVVAETDWSPWLLMFCLFVFLALAVVKRCSELVVMRELGRVDAAGRGYRTADLPVLTAMAAAAGYAAVLVFGFYLSSPEVAALYRHPQWLWGACPLQLAWISRIMLLAHRGELHDDPVVFALSDRPSLVTGACFAAVIATAI